MHHLPPFDNLLTNLKYIITKITSTDSLLYNLSISLPPLSHPALNKLLRILTFVYSPQPPATKSHLSNVVGFFGGCKLG